MREQWFAECWPINSNMGELRAPLPKALQLKPDRWTVELAMSRSSQAVIMAALVVSMLLIGCSEPPKRASAVPVIFTMKAVSPTGDPPPSTCS